MVGVLPSRQIRFFRSARPKALKPIPSTSAANTALEAYRPASSLRSCPSSREVMDPAPTPTIKPIAWMTPMMEYTMPTAPEALVPIWETK